MRCVGCAGDQLASAGRDRQGRQSYRCTFRGQRQTERSASAFCGYRFPDAISAAQVVCSGHGFSRGLGPGFYRLRLVLGHTCIPRTPRLMRARAELITGLQPV